MSEEIQGSGFSSGAFENRGIQVRMGLRKDERRLVDLGGNGRVDQGGAEMTPGREES